MTAAVPSPAELAETIAERADVDSATVADVLTAHGISLVPVPPVSRSVGIRRLKFSGTKTGTASDGPFSAEFTFGDGVTALITEKNLRGKSSVLELLTWALRGSPRRLRADVKPWLDTLTLEYEVNGKPLAVRVTAVEGGHRYDIVTAADAATLAAALDGEVDAKDRVQAIASDLTETEFKERQEASMLEALSLEPLTNWQKYPGSDQGRPQVNGWPAYFGAIYLPDASSELLLGDTHFGQLPARLLQIFCNVPLLGSSIKARTLNSQARQDDANQVRRVDEDAKARESGHAALRERLTEIEGELSQPPAAASGRAPEAISTDLRTAEHDLDTAAAQDRAARLLLAEAVAARQAEAVRQNNARETALAAALFQGLSPRHCPRCERPISAERARRETDEHRCAVCTDVIELTGVDPDDHGHDTQADDPGAEAVEDDEGADPLQALADAEQAARASATLAAQSRERAQSVVDELTAELSAASTAAAFTRRRALELEAARLSGHLDATTATPEDPKPHNVTSKILDAADSVLSEVSAAAAVTIFDELNTEIADLGRKFGIDNLDAVALDRRGGLKATTAGVSERFSKLTGGERLRLRVAVLVALLRVGHRAGVGSHPGLIMLDSPGSDELTVEDEATLLRELDSLKDDLPHLQVVVASAEPAAVRGQIDDQQVYAATGDGPLW